MYHRNDKGNANGVGGIAIYSLADLANPTFLHAYIDEGSSPTYNGIAFSVSLVSSTL